MRIVLFFLFCFVSVVGSPSIAEEFVYDDHGRRDPMWPLVSPSGTIVSYDKDVNADDLFLEGIISDQQGYVAIINGMIVKKGDAVIGGYLVQSVTQNEVILIKDEEKFILILNKEE